MIPSFSITKSDIRFIPDPRSHRAFPKVMVPMVQGVSIRFTHVINLCHCRVLRIISFFRSCLFSTIGCILPSIQTLRNHVDVLSQHFVLSQYGIQSINFENSFLLSSVSYNKREKHESVDFRINSIRLYSLTDLQELRMEMLLPSNLDVGFVKSPRILLALLLFLAAISFSCSNVSESCPYSNNPRQRRQKYGGRNCDKRVPGTGREAHNSIQLNQQVYWVIQVIPYVSKGRSHRDCWYEASYGHLVNLNRRVEMLESFRISTFLLLSSNPSYSFPCTANHLSVLNQVGVESIDSFAFVITPSLQEFEARHSHSIPESYSEYHRQDSSMYLAFNAKLRRQFPNKVWTIIYCWKALDIYFPISLKARHLEFCSSRKSISSAGRENQADLRSTEGRYVSSKTLPAVNLGSDDPYSQGRTEQSSVNQPSQSMLIPTDSNMMVVREQTPSEALAVVPIQVFVPASQTTTETDFEPTPMLRIEGTTETTPEPPKQLQETTSMLPPAPTKIHPAAEDAAALLMMAQTATYVPKTDPGMPSFSLGLTDSSQEGASTQETEREKSPETANLLEQLDDLVQKLASSAAKGKNESPQIQRETGGESSTKFETPGGINQIPDDMKQKCYIWGTRLKEDADGNTNEYEEICTLIGQGEYILIRMHLASLQAKSDIESQIVSAICLILNQKNEKRFQEQIYCLPPDIMSMALSDHPKGEFISPKTKKEFTVEAYPSFIPFINRKKLTSHPYIFAPICHSGHWWLWLINTTKRKCQILDPLHKKAPSNERKDINKFTGYVFSRLITYAGGEPLEKGENEKKIKASYVKISGQKTSYDCAIYVMKWLELIEPENIKRGSMNGIIGHSSLTDSKLASSWDKEDVPFLLAFNASISAMTLSYARCGIAVSFSDSEVVSNEMTSLKYSKAALLLASAQKASLID
ncbi:hypothetical protein AHAS_Ahas10G0117600 [Arachis hypogaea]